MSGDTETSCGEILWCLLMIGFMTAFFVWAVYDCVDDCVDAYEKRVSEIEKRIEKLEKKE